MRELLVALALALGVTEADERDDIDLVADIATVIAAKAAERRTP